MGKYSLQILNQGVRVAVPMSEADTFHDLIRRVRTGDHDAAAQFVCLYEPAIRRAARVRNLDPRLSPLLDSGDIVQSVFASFFVRAALGQYELDQPRQVLNLLVAMSRKKLANFARKQAAARRDYRRQSTKDPQPDQLAGGGADPGQQAATQELIEEFRKRLTPEERELAESRALGRNWDEIAATRSDTAEALRKKLGRAVSRISHELGLEEDGDA
jgi:RNA polymerase sigma factor (sigma-70 family)